MADTYYVRADGIVTAANKANATSDGAAATSLNAAEHNLCAFAIGDAIIVSDAGGNYQGSGALPSAGFKPPTNGASGTRITYVNSGTPKLIGADLIVTWTLYSGDIWEAAVSSEPEQVWMDDTFGDKRSGTGDMTDQYDWYWSGGTLYIWTGAANDPDTYYTSPGVEADGRVAVPFNLSTRIYLTIDGMYMSKASLAVMRAWQGNAGESEYLTIQNCTAEWGYRWGIDIAQETPALPGPSRGSIVQDCTTRYNGEHGIHMPLDAHDCIVRRNICYENAKYSQYGVNNGGIKFFGGYGGTPERNIVEHNHVYDNGHPTSTTRGRGVGIWFDACAATSGNENIIRYNYTHDNRSYGIFVEISDYHIVLGNLSHDDCQCGSYCAGIGVVAWGTRDVEYNKVYNNTVYGSLCFGIEINTKTTDGNANVNYNEVKNNIVDNSTDRELYCYRGGCNDAYGTGNVYDYNCFGTQYGGFINWSVNKATYAEWETAYGGTTNSIELDPLLNNVGADEYWLQSGSPCRDTGADLGAAYDDALDKDSSWPSAVITLNQYSYGSGWDLGAYIYESGSSFVLILRKSGTDEITLDIDAAGKPIVYENGVPRITGSNSDVSDGDDVQVILDSTSVSLFVNDAQISTTYSSLTVIGGTGWEINPITGPPNAIEFWPLYLNILDPTK